MSLNKITTALTALALVASPTMAAAQTASQPLAPASETVNGSELRGGTGFGQIIPIIVIAAIVLLIHEVLVKDRDVGNRPRSP